MPKPDLYAGNISEKEPMPMPKIQGSSSTSASMAPPLRSTSVSRTGTVILRTVMPGEKW